MHGTTLHNLQELKEQYDSLRVGKDALLTLLEEAELPESVYNSNAIENSTMTLQETEKLLLHQDIPANHSQREVFEAINLAKVKEFLQAKITKEASLTEEMILLVHRTLLTNIADDCAGRYRALSEHVRVGTHIAPAPEEVPVLMEKLLTAFDDDGVHILDRIIYFHLSSSVFTPS